MANSYKPGTEPPCPDCGGPIRSTSSTTCHRCWVKRKQKEAAERKAAEAATALGTTAPIPETREPLSSYDDAWLLFQREIGMARDRFVPTIFPPADPRRRVVTVAEDLHIPWHESEMLADLIVREAHRTDVLVLNGDTSDAYALSRFIQYEWMPFRDEWARVVATLDTIAAAFREVVIVVGNHDARLEKQLLTRLTADMVEALRFMTGGALCPITMLAKRYPNVSIAHHTLPSGHTADWFTMIGDAWIGHPEVFSTVPTGATRKVEQVIATKAEEWGMSAARLVVIGHTHQRSDIPWRQARLVEPGCLCQTQGYQVSPKVSATTQRRGYLTFTQTDGRTDYNSVYVHDYDEWARLRAMEAA